MSHDPERDAAAFLGGVMRSGRRARFERHLLECEECWREVAAGRLGRRLAESTRELAPASLRENVRAAVEALPRPPRRFRAALTAAVLALVVAGVFGATWLRADQPASIARALKDFHEGRIPTQTASGAPAPDLAALELVLTSSGSGALEGLHVDAYSYRAPNGRRLLLYLSETPFPVASGARQQTPDGPWRARVDDLELLCAQEPHALLAISDDPALLEGLAGRLGIPSMPA